MNENNGRINSDNFIMTVHDIAIYLRLSEAKVYKLAKEGQLPALRVGKSWRFRKDLIDDWIRRETELALESRIKSQIESRKADLPSA
jgi:excisionase family DNA binding protein